MMGDSTPLSQNCVRALTGKLYDKRKGAALEIESLVRDHVLEDQKDAIIRVLKYLGGDLVQDSHNPHYRKGGLIGLAAAAIGLGKMASQYVDQLLLPCLSCVVHGTDTSVTYQACEALFNVVKVVRASAFPYFDDLFHALTKLVVHPNEEVRGGAGLLDRLIKDIATESPSFDLVGFLPLLREGVYMKNVEARQFVLSWIEVLDAVPDINMVIFLPEILDGLFLIVEEKCVEVSKMCQNILAGFLEAIKADQGSAINLHSLANILTLHGQSDHLLAQAMALVWLGELVSLRPNVLVSHVPPMLNAVLPCMAFCDLEHDRVKSAAEELNSRLHNMVLLTDNNGVANDDGNNGDANDDDGNDDNNKADCQQSSVMGTGTDESSGSEEEKVEKTLSKNDRKDSRLDVRLVLEVLLSHLSHRNVQTRMSVLKWIDHLLTKAPVQTFRCVPLFFNRVLDTLFDASDCVVLLGLKILSEIASSPSGNEINVADLAIGEYGHHHRLLLPTIEALTVPHDGREIVESSLKGLNSVAFNVLVVEIVLLFHHSPRLFEDRGVFIVRHLCVSLGAEAVFSSMAEVIVKVKDVTFASKVARSLNTILLTSPELYELRCQLRDCNTKETRALFCRLYRCWCHSPVSTLSLCYLTQNYSHAFQLIQHFVDVEMTVEILKDMDQLVQLIESPVFSYLRLHLLDGEKNTYLIRSLYSMLMLMPQSEAFRVLKCRLECVTPHCLSSPSAAQIGSSEQEESTSDSLQVSEVPFSELLQHFVSVQTSHRESTQRSLANRLSQLSIV